VSELDMLVIPEQIEDGDYVIATYYLQTGRNASLLLFYFMPNKTLRRHTCYNRKNI